MNKMEKALFELGEMDDLAAGNSPIHRVHPLSKLLATMVYIAAVVSFGKYRLSGVAGMALIPVLLFQISGIPVRTCFRRLRVAMPLVMAVGLFHPLLDRAPALTLGAVTVSGGVISMLTLMLKGVLCLMASFLLIATTGIDRLCAALRQLRLPPMLVTLLLLTYRYVGLMIREASVMTEAYRLRAPGQRGVHYTAWGSFLGQLLLRSMDRAEALYSAMQLRGFCGEFHYADPPPFGVRDALWLLVWTCAPAVLRLVDVAGLIGGALV